MCCRLHLSTCRVQTLYGLHTHDCYSVLPWLTVHFRFHDHIQSSTITWRWRVDLCGALCNQRRHTVDHSLAPLLIGEKPDRVDLHPNLDLVHPNLQTLTWSFRSELKMLRSLEELGDQWMSLKTAQEVIQTSKVTSPMLLCLSFPGKVLY